MGRKMATAKLAIGMLSSSDSSGQRLEGLQAESRHTFASLAVAAAAIGLGIPLYLLLDAAQILPPALRDRPWPLELLALLGAVATFFLAGRSRVSTACLAVALLNAIALVVFARHVHHRLDPAPATLAIGSRAPAVSLRDEAGRPMVLGFADRRPTLVAVFRGSWCPYCRTQLSRLSVQARRFSSADVRVLAVSTDSPEAHARLKRSLALPFPLLSDPDAKIAAQCASTHCLLLFDSSGALRWGSFSENWRTPPRYEDVLQAAYRLK
jgi:peroxiredoxin